MHVLNKQQYHLSVILCTEYYIAVQLVRLLEHVIFSVTLVKHLYLSHCSRNNIFVAGMMEVTTLGKKLVWALMVHNLLLDGREDLEVDFTQSFGLVSLSCPGPSCLELCPNTNHTVTLGRVARSGCLNILRKKGLWWAFFTNLKVFKVRMRLHVMWTPRKLMFSTHSTIWPLMWSGACTIL